MIKSIRGKIIAINPPYLTIEAAGVGYGVAVPLELLDNTKIDKEIFLLTYHHISDTRQDLYGFADVKQRDFFQMLISVSGVGPKTALSIISSHKTDMLRAAVAEGNLAVFKSASGVGKKTAERIIVELKDKLDLEGEMGGGFGETYEALSSLGYKPAEIRSALKAVPADIKDTTEQIKIALKSLAK